MCCGVRKALGPGLFTFSRENSLQGGELQATPTSPEKQSLVRSLMTLSSKRSCVACSAKSNRAKKSPPNVCNALESGQFCPAKRSKKSLGMRLVPCLEAWLCDCTGRGEGSGAGLCTDAMLAGTEHRSSAWVGEGGRVALAVCHCVHLGA